MIRSRLSVAVPVACAALALVAFSFGQSSADSPAEKPRSVEDELRELKRRADDSDRKHAQQLKENEKLRGELVDATAKAEKAVKDRFEKVDERAALDRVPVGAMVPYFGDGDAPPKGYVFADGRVGKDGKRARWPRADWVPEHLRGEDIPDMRQHLVGGAKDIGQVGLPWDKGVITIPKITVKGENFTTPATQNVTMRGNFRKDDPWHKGREDDAWVVLWHNRDGWNKGDYSNLNFIEAAVGNPKNGFWFRATPVPAVYKLTEGNIRGAQDVGPIPLSLNQPETNPRHVMCRWIIRVE
jgi:hypothetical protein